MYIRYCKINSCFFFVTFSIIFLNKIVKIQEQKRMTNVLSFYLDWLSPKKGCPCSIRVITVCRVDFNLVICEYSVLPPLLDIQQLNKYYESVLFVNWGLAKNGACPRFKNIAVSNNFNHLQAKPNLLSILPRDLTAQLYNFVHGVAFASIYNMALTDFILGALKDTKSNINIPFASHFRSMSAKLCACQ